MRDAMIIEPGERNYSAYLPDLPGCVATGNTIDELRQRMSEAIELHLQGLREDGLPIRNPQASRTMSTPPRSISAKLVYRAVSV